MSGILFVDTVTHVPAVWANAVNTLVYDIFGASTTLAQAQQRLGLQSLAYQLHSQVNITGGNINGVEMGTVTPVTRMVAKAGSVIDDPVADTDIVNKGWMRAWIQNALTTTQTEWLGGLGTMAVQNANNVRIIAGTIDSTDIGLHGRASGKFTTLKAANPPIDGDDVVTLGWLTQHYDVRLNALRSMAYQDANSVAISGGELDGVRIGLTVPAVARLANGTIIAVPTTYESIVNKRYVDSSLSAALANFKTMAYQDSFAVSITGGTIDGTDIGYTAPARAVFTDLTVQKNSAWLYLKTLSTGPGNLSGIQWRDGANEVGRLAYYGANNLPLNNAIELRATVPIQIQSDSGAGIRMDGTNTRVYGPNVRIIEALNDKLIVGGGAAKTGYAATFNRPGWFEGLGAKRGFFEQGHSDGYDTTYATVAAGTLTLQTHQNSAAFINLTGNATVQFAAQDATWIGLRVVRLIIRHDVGGRTLNWPANVFWVGGFAPDYSTSLAQDFDLVELWTFNGGASWFAKSAYGTLDTASEVVAILMAAN